MNYTSILVSEVFCETRSRTWQSWFPFWFFHVTFRLWMRYTDVLYYHKRETRSIIELHATGAGVGGSLQTQNCCRVDVN